MKNKGFTLIELLVVISIIGVLATVILSSLGEAKGKTTDIRTAHAITQLRNGIELFYLDNGHYPDSRNGVDWIGVCNSENSYSSHYHNDDFINDLNPYIPSLSIFDDCDGIYYYSKVSNVSPYYQGVCDVIPITNEQGYMISYSMFNTLHDQFFFWEDSSTGEKYHCRSHNL